ncbi:hypothetical protein, partial [Streptomyces mirabilis]|uniref:hypothetical protein n=1 Tax=Streptomyces mirabilis TaxID=68239 RepID=UPI003710EED4
CAALPKTTQPRNVTGTHVRATDANIGTATASDILRRSVTGHGYGDGMPVMSGKPVSVCWMSVPELAVSR